MSSQINFKLTYADLLEITNYLEQNNIRVALSRSDTQSFASIQISDIQVGFFRLILSDNAVINTKIVTPYEGNPYYFFDIEQSEAVEFNFAPDNRNKNIFIGRFYYISGYWDTNKQWISKNTEFIKQAEKLFRWIKKQYKRTTNATYISEASQVLVFEPEIINAM